MWRGSRLYERVQARGHGGCSKFQNNVCKAVGGRQKRISCGRFQAVRRRILWSGNADRQAFVSIGCALPGFRRRGRSSFRPVGNAVVGHPHKSARPTRSGEHFVLSTGHLRQLLVHEAGWPICRLRDRSAMFSQPLRLPSHSVGKHRYARHCYQNAQALVAWHIAAICRVFAAGLQGPPTVHP